MHGNGLRRLEDYREEEIYISSFVKGEFAYFAEEFVFERLVSSGHFPEKKIDLIRFSFIFLDLN